MAHEQKLPIQMTLPNKKIVVIIPAYNEQDHILDVIKSVPSCIAGIKDIEVVIINDGSTDATLEIVKKAGIRHIINFNKNLGLGKVFRKGVSHALKIGAEIIVTIDADCQYSGDEIDKIARPILEQKAGMVVGNRRLLKIEFYPFYKLIAQLMANKLVEIAFDIRSKEIDVTSGFRAYSKDSAYILKETLKNNYTHTLESICILAKKKIPITFCPIKIRYPTRESRLIKSKVYYVVNFLATLIRCYLTIY